MRIGERTYNIRLGFTIFLAITIVSAVVIIYLDADKNTWSALKEIKPQYGLFAGCLVIIQWLLNGLRFQVLLNSFEKKVKFQTSFNAYMANVFMSAMTPSQSGGGPLQIYVLNRSGLSIAKAFAGCLMGAVLNVTCLVLINLAILIFEPNLKLSYGHHLGSVLLVVFIIFVLLTLLFMLSLIKINLLKRLFGYILICLSKILKLKKKITIVKKVLRGLDQYSNCMKLFAKAKKTRVITAGILTILCLISSNLIAPVLLTGLNIQIDFFRVFLIQFIITFILYFSPTPGASGVAEFSNYWIMSSVDIDQNLLGVYTIIWRFFTSFIGVSVGAIIVLGLLRGKKKI